MSCTIPILSLLASTAALQPAPQQEARVTPLLSLTGQGCEALLVDPKDQPLREALGLLGARLLELPEEIPDFDAPPGLLPLVLRLLDGPGSLTIGESSRAVAGMPLPLVGELRLVRPDAADARDLSGELVAFLGDMGLELGERPESGAWVMPAPLPLWMGDEGRHVFLRLGAEGGVEPASQRDLLPEGAQVAFSGMLDYGTAMELVSSVAAGDPDFDEMMEMLAGFGMDDFSIAWACGTDDERTHFVIEMPGWAAAAEAAGLVPPGELQPETVALIPADATWASAMTFDLAGAAELYRGIARDMAGVDLDELIREHTGLDLEADLVAPWGGAAVFYAADSTGGGGLFSTVTVVELADREAFARTFGTLERHLAELGQQELEGYLRVSHFEDRGLDFGVLSFPGLPIPFELCFTTTEDYAVFGLTPGAVSAAVLQIRSEGAGLIDNPHFQAQLGEVEGIQALSWVNTPRLLQDGYGLTSLMCSALANGVRSPADPGREPGRLMPTFAELRRGAKGMLTVSRRVGDDYRSETRMDRSQLVNATGTVGYLCNSPFTLLVGAGIGAGLVVPEVMKAQHQAEIAIEQAEAYRAQAEAQEAANVEARVEADFVALYEALERYAANNGGRYPDTLDELAVRDANGAAYVDAKHLIDPWGDAYLYSPPMGEDSEPQIDLAD